MKPVNERRMSELHQPYSFVPAAGRPRGSPPSADVTTTSTEGDRRLRRMQPTVFLEKIEIYG